MPRLHVPQAKAEDLIIQLHPVLDAPIEIDTWRAPFLNPEQPFSLSFIEYWRLWPYTTPGMTSMR
jgi:hypothetical protein